jgi:NAD(P)-dependent dehydrogenase (short-subunit alcohol dehydrogenase family)
LVTGASRGIGRAIAVALARAGFDVAITARTVHEGQGVDETTGRPLPGSLDTTASEVEALGGTALPIAMDLLDFGTIDAAADHVLSLWGPPDVLVNNAIYQGAGRTSRFLESTDDQLAAIVRGNVLAQWHLLRLMLPPMLDRGEATIIQVTSAAGMSDPPVPTGEGGWSLGYGASKGAFHRTCGVLHAEHARDGLRIFNLEPGLVHTERMRAIHGDHYQQVAGPGTTPEVIGSVAVFLATDPEAESWRGRTLHAQPFAAERGIG